LIGEPSDLQFLLRRQGMAVLKSAFPFEEDESRYRSEHDLRESTSTQRPDLQRKAAHSSTPQLGENATKKMTSTDADARDLTVMEIDGGVNFNTVPANAFWKSTRFGP